MDSEYKESDGWVKCKSNSRPGLQYYFNKKTRESVWTDTSNTKTASKPNTDKKTELIKTPAQDRLKRLQSKLHKTKNKDKKTHVEKTTKTNGEVIAKLPVTPKEATTNTPTVQKAEKNKTATGPPEDAKTRDNLTKKEEKTENLTTKVDPTTSKPSNGIVRKFKELQKTVSETAKKALDEASKAISSAAASASRKRSFKAKTSKPEKSILKTAAVENAVNELRTLQEANAYFTEVSSINGKKLSTPSYRKGSANLRLEKLRQSLTQQSFSQGALIDTSVKDVALETKEPPCDDVVEPMDWQSMDEDDQEATTAANSVNLNIIEAPKTPVPNASEFYDNVNENLLRLTADKDQTRTKDKKKWEKDYYYFVLDTNVLLEYLTFVDDLSKMKLCDTKGTMLYIPYVTLQELDGLKMRKTDESVKTRAIRAIKYLNVHLHSSNMRAQSAVDERKHLIKISSADDSILNCCLQVKEHVDNVILLSEDANLRNKAISSDILVSTKSDLISIHVKSL